MMNYKTLMAAVKLMGQGMMAVFVVMIAISAVVYLFARFFSERNKGGE